MTIYQQINEAKNAAGLPVFTGPAKYTIRIDTATEKDHTLQAIRAAGAVVVAVSNRYGWYYIEMDATEEQAEYIQRTAYTDAIDRMTPREAWAAWKGQRLTVGQMAIYQERHGLTFDQRGNVTRYDLLGRPWSVERAR